VINGGPRPRDCGEAQSDRPREVANGIAVVISGRPLEHQSSALTQLAIPWDARAKRPIATKREDPATGNREELPHPHAETAICFAEYISTGGGTRTPTPLRALDFESPRVLITARRLASFPDIIACASMSEKWRTCLKWRRGVAGELHAPKHNACLFCPANRCTGFAVQ
jgi:hypothetical protein